ncbi:MAG: DUF4249 domain-containing protein [Bacteroidales bacterium]
MIHFTVVICLVGLTACQKVINFDLNSPSPQLVVEANLSDQLMAGIVILSQTVNFNEITQIPPVTGAVVEISDSTSGINEILHEASEGVYVTGHLKGIPGHRYRMKIEVNGQEYNAVSEMPYPVGIQSLEIISELHYPSLAGGTDDEPTLHYRVKFEIADPAEYANYYRFVIYHKNRIISSHRVFSDQFHNGKIIADDFLLHDSDSFDPGDTIRIELLNIDKNTYNFFRTLRDGAGGLSFLSASPSNPVSNISNEGLGYFSASSVKEGYVVVP